MSALSSFRVQVLAVMVSPREIRLSPWSDSAAAALPEGTAVSPSLPGIRSISSCEAAWVKVPSFSPLEEMTAALPDRLTVKPSCRSAST